MGGEIAYAQPASSVVATAVSIATSETTLATLSDQKYFRKSQLSAYFDISLGSATSVKLRYYMSADNDAVASTLWYELPIKNTSTGQLQDVPSVIDSTSPLVSGTRYRTVEDIPLSGGFQLKITGQAVGATATLNSLNVFTKDN